jgi:hypothetical protein
MPPLRIRHAALALIAVATIADARDKVPAATPIGKAENCVQLQSIRETRVRDDQTIDFYMRGGKVYRNTLAGVCPQLGFEERYTYQTSIGSLCSTDIVTVLQGPNLMRGASCGLGKFQPVKLAPR